MQKKFSIADKIPEECLEAKGNICKTEVHFQGYIPNLMRVKAKQEGCSYISLRRWMAPHPYSL